MQNELIFCMGMKGDLKLIQFRSQKICMLIRIFPKFI